jgi:Ni,Fe-hydrogenase I large subunit
MVSQLDEAMLNHLSYLALIEGRPPSYRDFQSFEFNGKTYGMTHGTYRNKIWKFKKEGRVETEYNAGTAFHTLKDVHFGKRRKEGMMTPMMTPNHMVVSPVTGVTNKEDDEISKTAIYKAIQELPSEQKSVHDIHLTYTVPDIYTIATLPHHLPTYPNQSAWTYIFQY